MTNYRTKYIKIYLWQAISIILGFASLFIVVPYLSSNKTLYGIYSVCTSLTIFLSYADLGFLSSGLKYAAEYYIRGEKAEEVKVIGFTAILMLIVFLVIDAVFVFLGFNPQILIPELEANTDNYRIAQTLIFLLASGCPLIIIQRVLSIIFTIRVEDYKYQRITIFAGLLRITAAVILFSGGKYRVVEYYAFYQFVNLLIVIVALISIKRYGYNVKSLIRAVRFDKGIFKKEISLSMASFLFMISMLLYNELDQIAISNIFGIQAVALYAAAFSIMTFIRTYSSLVYSPYSSRYNHYIGIRNYHGLVEFTKKMVRMFGPILVLPIVNVALFSDAFVVSWLGEEYTEAAILVSFLVLSYTPNFMTQPLSCYMTASEKNKKIVTGAILLPLVYWGGIIVLSQLLDVKSFAIMKFAAPALLVFFYWGVISQDVRKLGFAFLNPWKILGNLLVPIAVAVLMSYALHPYMRYAHDRLSLFINILFIGVATIISLASSLVTNKDLREQLRIVFNKFIAVFIK